MELLVEIFLEAKMSSLLWFPPESLPGQPVAPEEGGGSSDGQPVLELPTSNSQSSGGLRYSKEDPCCFLNVGILVSILPTTCSLPRGTDHSGFMAMC